MADFSVNQITPAVAEKLQTFLDDGPSALTIKDVTVPYVKELGPPEARTRADIIGELT